MKHPFQLKNAALLMVLAVAWPLQVQALAGIAQFTAGEVNVRQADGRITALAKGGNIDSGHAIVTGGDGRAQVRFTDGGLVSLQPNTEFRIASYVDQNNPREDRFLVDLLRGSMRAITGLIGKRNRDNYKLTTTTATIGIRGSGFKVGYNPDGSLGITSELDKIEVCNQSGCIGLVAGESVKVLDNVTPPVRTSEQPKVATPDTRKEPVVAGDKVDDAGKAKIVTEKATTTATPLPVERTFTDIKVAAVGVYSGSPHTLSTGAGATTVFSDNKLLKLQDTSANTPKWSE
ncbi:FecR family protein, partial [Polaromonas sp.]